MIETYFHATDYKNLESILEKGIIPGPDGMVYLADNHQAAGSFVTIRGCRDILVVEVELDDTKVVESFDHSQQFFKCRAWMHKGNIIPEYITNLYRYRLDKK